MCGICGIVESDGDPSLRAGRVDAMTRALVHRGPDDEGRHDEGPVSLGFRRLAVIDLETGQQPIRLESGRATIVLNGEIYNYRELRRELEPRHRFRSQGDVEVVLRLYDEYGIEGLARLNGMFALAIWDRERRTLFLARDRFGIKPLFVCREGDALAFSSEVRALFAGGFPGDRELDLLELRHYLAQKYLSPEGTIFRSVRSVPPGTVVEIGPAGERRHRYWNPPEPAVDAGDDDEAVQQLAALIERAAERQLVADVPVGLFLSGGLDSGTLASIVRRRAAGEVKTFSVGFDSPDVANELPLAADTARRLGTVHRELLLEPRQVAADLPAILGGLDGPLGDATVIPTWFMSELARREVTVALSGEGADEMFGGYDRQRFDAWMDRLGPVGRTIAPSAMRLAGRPPSARMRERLRMPPGLARQLDWSRIFTSAEIDQVAAVSLPDEDELISLHAALARQWCGRAEIDPINARLATDRELFLVGDLLPKVDRMSMAHSLEVRVPFLDDDLAEFVLAQPGTRKVRGRQVKWLLRKYAESVLPPEVSGRRKQGFDVPISAWLRGALREAATDYLAPATVSRRGLFDAKVVQRMLNEHLAGDVDHGERLWLLVALEGWMQDALDRAPAEHARTVR